MKIKKKTLLRIGAALLVLTLLSVGGHRFWEWKEKQKVTVVYEELFDDAGYEYEMYQAVGTRGQMFVLNSKSIEESTVDRWGKTTTTIVVHATPWGGVIPERYLIQSQIEINFVELYGGITDYSEWREYTVSIYDLFETTKLIRKVDVKEILEQDGRFLPHERTLPTSAWMDSEGEVFITQRVIDADRKEFTIFISLDDEEIKEVSYDSIRAEAEPGQLEMEEEAYYQSETVELEHAPGNPFSITRRARFPNMYALSYSRYIYESGEFRRPIEGYDAPICELFPQMSNALATLKEGATVSLRLYDVESEEELARLVTPTAAA